MVNTIKQALEQRLDRKVALSSVYTLLHRHGWRKLAPDKRHRQTGVAAKVFSVGIAIERHVVMVALAIDSQLPPTVYGRLRDSVGIASACDRRRVGSTPSTLPLP
ncbi:MAG TPA: winged helix-turn-helix domain-containing protein [Gammaproteobacteria bacterium]|nr:winged helix-turn-helix domain-containing protein [Gammaproteobacteria bacterium]